MAKASKIVRDELTAEYLRAVLDYDPASGALKWKERTSSGFLGRVVSDAQRDAWNAAHSGRPVGYRNPTTGYLVVSIAGSNQYAHRLIWRMVTGEWPAPECDHIDLNKTNNAWVNLRPATNTQNGANKCLSPRNKSGFKGVSWSNTKRRWVATISIRKKVKFLGYRDTPEAAYQLYCAAAANVFGDFARLT